MKIRCHQPSPGATLPAGVSMPLTPDKAESRSLRQGIRRVADSLALFIRLAEREKAKRKAAEAALDREHAQNEIEAIDLRAALEQKNARLGVLSLGLKQALAERDHARKGWSDAVGPITVGKVALGQAPDSCPEALLTPDEKLQREARKELETLRAAVAENEKVWLAAIQDAKKERDRALDLATASAPDRARDQLLQGLAYELDRVAAGGIALKTPVDARAFCARLLDTLPADVRPKKESAA